MLQSCRRCGILCTDEWCDVCERKFWYRAGVALLLLSAPVAIVLAYAVYELLRRS